MHGNDTRYSYVYGELLQTNINMVICTWW